jgi:hypothetical protein
MFGSVPLLCTKNAPFVVFDCMRIRRHGSVFSASDMGNAEGAVERVGIMFSTHCQDHAELMYRYSWLCAQAASAGRIIILTTHFSET